MHRLSGRVAKFMECCINSNRVILLHKVISGDSRCNLYNSPWCNAQNVSLKSKMQELFPTGVTTP